RLSPTDRTRGNAPGRQENALPVLEFQTQKDIGRSGTNRRLLRLVVCPIGSQLPDPDATRTMP
ncbi:MAG: hypothetical protein P4L98_18155, partial [Ancalomicrobiaceae bacterium]|nr:hypothetical protein [Ancalomicrobiaceae bacterium]